MTWFTDVDRRWWMQFAGPRLDPFRDQPTEEITRDTFGRLSVDSTVGCGVYVVLDPDDDVMYVGKVDREGTIADRFRDHHAANDDWDRVWIMPLKVGVDPTAIELAMIKHFRPPCNTLGVP